MRATPLILFLAATLPASHASADPSPPAPASAPTPGKSPAKPPAKAPPKSPPRTPLWEQKGALSVDPPARRLVVDRVAALVGDKIITLAEVRRRSMGAKRAYAALPLAERVEAERKVEQQMLDKMIDEILEGEAAKAKGIVVKESEIETGLQQVEAQNGLTREGLIKAVRDAGMTEIEYRADLSRQLLHYKVLKDVITPRTTTVPGISSDEWMKRLEAEFAVWIEELRREAFVEVRS